jgi:hypothetical protein
MRRTRTIGLLAAALATALVAAGAASAGSGRGILYQFRGHLLATPPANATQISISVEGGNRPALRAMLGHSVEQTFTVGSGTEFLEWSNGVPTVVQANELAAGDWVNVNVRARRGADLDRILHRPAGIVGDHGTSPFRPDRPLYLFRGRIVASGSGSVTVDVRGGNRRALRLLVGQSSQQTFATGGETIFLLWQGKVPTVIGSSDLKAGDLVVVRVRAAAGSTLAQVTSTAATRVAEHERASTR